MSKKKNKREKRMHNVIDDFDKEPEKPCEEYEERKKKEWLEKLKSEVNEAIKERDKQK